MNTVSIPKTETLTQIVSWLIIYQENFKTYETKNHCSPHMRKRKNIHISNHTALFHLVNEIMSPVRTDQKFKIPLLPVE